MTSNSKEYQREYMRAYLKRLTPEQIKKRADVTRAWHANLSLEQRRELERKRSASESKEVKERRKKRNREKSAKRYAALTMEQRKAQYQKIKASKKIVMV